MSSVQVSGSRLARARDDLATFAALVGHPLTPWQVAALTLRCLFSVIVGPRQVGKSRALSVLAVWWAFRRPGQTVLIVSAGERSSRRLLGQVRRVLDHPLLAGEVVEESGERVLLGNGSQIVSVPASERAIRGFTVDLLLVDEAAFVSDDVLEGAALPTITAREAEGARVVMACTAWEASGLFYRFAMQGEGGHDDVETFRWRLADASTDNGGWITPGYIDLMRSTMDPLRWRTEYECEFVQGGAGFFSRDDLMAAVSPYCLTPPDQAEGGTVVLGADWGNRIDSHAVTLLGVVDDYGLNGHPVFFLPWLETSQARYRVQVDRVARIAKAAPRRGWRGGFTAGNTGVPFLHPGQANGYQVAQVLSETNGVGGPATEALEDALGEWRVTRVNTTQASKELAFGRLLDLLSSDALVLPDEPQLLRELAGLEASPTGNGGVRIAAAGSGHDDLALSLSFAALALTPDMEAGPRSDPSRRPPPEDWVTAPNGLTVPAHPSPVWGGFHSTRHYVHVTN